jgi:hypothetical protein
MRWQQQDDSLGALSTTGNQAFAVRFGRTAKGKKRTANSLPCVFSENARQRAHGSVLHGKRSLPCAFPHTHGKVTFAVRKNRRTTKKIMNQKTTKHLFAMRRVTTHDKDFTQCQKKNISPPPHPTSAPHHIHHRRRARGHHIPCLPLHHRIQNVGIQPVVAPGREWAAPWGKSGCCSPEGHRSRRI